MARDTIIAERPVPPKGRLSFPMLILHMIANPVASWGEASASANASQILSGAGKALSLG